MAEAPRVLRHIDADQLAADAADTLVARLDALQRENGVATLCLTGGRIANRMLDHVATRIGPSGVDPGLLDLWWGDEVFLPTDDPARHSLQALSRLAGSFPLDPARTHIMPSRDVSADVTEAAYAYGRDLAGTTFDITLLGVGEDGHIGGIFPNHHSFGATQALAIGVTDAPKPPAERITLTVSAFNRSREVWFVASGAEKASAVERALAGDPVVPASHVLGVERTLWFLDEAAASRLPFHHCAL